MRIFIATVAVAVALVPAAASAQTRFTTATSTIGDILANPAAKAVLVKDAPGLVTDQLSGASNKTLVSLAESLKSFMPDMLSDQKLAQIDADFAKIPAK
jgi:para-nitrobenzyl esterase